MKIQGFALNFVFCCVDFGYFATLSMTKFRLFALNFVFATQNTRPRKPLSAMAGALLCTACVVDTSLSKNRYATAFKGATIKHLQVLINDIVLKYSQNDNGVSLDEIGDCVAFKDEIPYIFVIFVE